MVIKLIYRFSTIFKKVRLYSPAKDAPELPIFEFKGSNFKFESSFKENLMKKLKNLSSDSDWLPKFLKHMIVNHQNEN